MTLMADARLDGNCYHCGLSVPKNTDFSLTINNTTEPFCCPGCQAIAAAITEGGLGDFYQFRTQSSGRPDTNTDDYTLYDTASIQEDFVRDLEAGTHQAHLLISDISCAACVWLIEQYLHQYAAVTAVSVNADTHKCVITWRPDVAPLSELMTALAALGYRPIPATNDHLEQWQRQENRQALLRLGVAGIGMMQVGMVAIGLYAGGLQGISDNVQQLLRWVSLVIATPVVLFSAQPFFRAALRSLQTRHLSMDVPVAIAIGAAYTASCWATVRGQGDVYFDSVSMFTFFLLLGRYLEMRARHRNARANGHLTQLLPLSVTRVSRDRDGESRQTISVKQMRMGDWIRVRAGETFACDGEVKEGSSGVIEAMLTGEAEPVTKHPGDWITAGTLNHTGSLLVEVKALGNNTRLSAIEKWVDQAEHSKPVQVALADHLAGYFVAGVLVITALVAWYWSLQDPDKAFWISLSVLVVTCPCALSLATPTALTAAVSTLRRCGLLIRRGYVVEGLQRVTHVVFDKTGTLTLGEPQVEEVILCGALSRQQCLAIAAALETGSNHPIANAFIPYRRDTVYAEDIHTLSGMGVTGCIDGEHYRLGKPEMLACPGKGQWVLLSTNTSPLAWFLLADQVRDKAAAAVAMLQQQGRSVELLSGDNSGAVAEVARAVGIKTYHAGVTPEQKLAYIQTYQQQGKVVMVVGDGINDIPVLSGADISVAMGTAPDLTQTRADSLLLNGDLRQLPEALVYASRVRRIIRQNLAWALAYNSLALPLAAIGWVPPYAAAIGMSVSSLIVVVNALRLTR